jgi:hypothetical protein
MKLFKELLASAANKGGKIGYGKDVPIVENKPNTQAAKINSGVFMSNFKTWNTAIVTTSNLIAMKSLLNIFSKPSSNPNYYLSRARWKCFDFHACSSIEK